MEALPETKVIADGRHIRLVARGKWEFVERKKVSGIVGIIAVTDDHKLILIEQFRPPVNKRVIEIPAGLAGDVEGSEDESLDLAAGRELLEETGYSAGKMDRVAEGAASAGLSSEVITLFRATQLRKAGSGGGDGSEQIEIHEVPVDGVIEWLNAREKSGVLIDLKVYAGLCFIERS